MIGAELVPVGVLTGAVMYERWRRERAGERPPQGDTRDAKLAAALAELCGAVAGAHAGQVREQLPRYSPFIARRVKNQMKLFQLEKLPNERQLTS